MFGRLRRSHMTPQTAQGPVRGALRLVNVSGLIPRPADPKHVRPRDGDPDVLMRRFEAAELKLGDLLGQLVQAQTSLLIKSILDP